MECYNIYLLLWCIRLLSQSAGINPLRVARVAHGWLPEQLHELLRSCTEDVTGHM